MAPTNKTPIELLDNIYSLAYWMTGNEAESRDLVNTTYLNAGIETPEIELLKTFRNCYVDRYGQETEFCISEKSCKSGNGLAKSIARRAADVKLTVLLSELSGLKHADISDVLEKPVNTIRTWLFWGRKLLVQDDIMKASA
ncbi:MAG: RNA polymerase subunit sigma-24 [Chlorobiaceae bacterium]|nr:RNA polymerase subunit sigma-24 [Chlorobiaceae bacterium]